MTKVKDIENTNASAEAAWTSNLRPPSYFRGTGGGGTSSDTKYLASGKKKSGSGVEKVDEEELKLLGSPKSPSHKPIIATTSTSPSPKSDPLRASKVKNDDDLLEHSNNDTLTINGLGGLDDIDHTTTYTGTINSLSKIRNRFSSKYGRMRKRVVFKNGDTNLHQTNISKRRRKYLADLFITLVDLQWRWTFLLFAMSFLSSWTCFAAIYWLICYTHGDLEVEHLQEGSGWKSCVNSLHSFTSAFLFSIETQTTIGYGSRYTTEECPEAIFMMCIQSILGTIIQAFMVGVVFTKMSRPKKRTETLMFSRNAVLNQRDGNLTLQFRVGDLRDQSHIICASIRAQLIKRRETSEGELLPFYQHELKVGVDSDQQAIFFIWPMVVVHKIDSDSPLYNISADELIKEKFEIVVILEGVIESTGATTQARSSYLPSEIMWGYRFEPLVSFKKELGEYAVDYSLFDNTYEVDTPRCSASDLADMQNTEADLTRKGLKILTPFHVSTVEQGTKGRNNATSSKANFFGAGTAITEPSSADKRFKSIHPV